MAFNTYLAFLPGSGSSPINAPAVSNTYFSTGQFSNAAVIQPVEFSFGAHNTVTIGSAAGGAGVGKAQFNTLVIKKLVDKTTSYLYQALVQGGHYPVVQLYLQNAGGTAAAAKPYLGYELQDVFVTDIEWSGSNGDETPSEQVTFAYASLSAGYRGQNPDGTFTPVTKYSWSQITNNTTLPVGSDTLFPS